MIHHLQPYPLDAFPLLLPYDLLEGGAGHAVNHTAVFLTAHSRLPRPTQIPLSLGKETQSSNQRQAKRCCHGFPYD